MNSNMSSVYNNYFRCYLSVNGGFLKAKIKEHLLKERNAGRYCEVEFQLQCGEGLYTQVHLSHCVLLQGIVLRGEESCQA